MNAVTRENSCICDLICCSNSSSFSLYFLSLSLSLSFTHTRTLFAMAQSHPTSPMSLAKICNSTNDDAAQHNLVPSLSIDRDDPNVQLAAEALGDMARTQGEDIRYTTNNKLLLTHTYIKALERLYYHLCLHYHHQVHHHPP